MKSAPGGDTVPTVTYPWLIAAHGIAAQGVLAPAPIACNGARMNNSNVVASCQGTPPLTAAGIPPVCVAYVPADDTVQLIIFNPAAAGALVAVAADVPVTIQCFPITP